MATKSKNIAVATPVAPESNGATKKTVCAISRETFRAKAPRALTVTINGVPFAAGMKEFSTGSFGWYLNGKGVVEIDGTPSSFQIGCNLTVVGSKEAK